MIQFDFKDKVVLVTGASRGMGAQILRQFVNAGAQGLLNFLPNEQNLADANALIHEFHSHGKKCDLAGFDVSQELEVQQHLEMLGQKFGKLDVLINNAGVLRDKTIRKMTSEDWYTVMRTNLDGVFFCCKYAAQILAEKGRIVNIASISGIVGFPGQANYSSAKAGVIALTKVLSKELASRNITVNAVAPGMIETSMLTGVRDHVLEEYKMQIPLKRFGQPEEVANAILFLASEEASYITGQVLPITGGWH
ncbi:MAG: SDR family oxidoreductase [Gemmataceae bacterium]|nr:SDR family oxidoreductase [Gemmataceae bacterium]